MPERLLEEPRDLQPVERKIAALEQSIARKAKRSDAGACWDWQPGECDVFVTAANVLALQDAATEPELVRSGVQWLIGKQDPVTGKWFARTHTEPQMAIDSFVLESAFDGEQLKRIHAADELDKKKNDRSREAVRKLVRSEASLQMAIRNQIQSGFATGLAMRVMLTTMASSVKSEDTVQLPPSCPPYVKREYVGACMRCHSKGGEAPIVFPFAPENMTAWQSALSKNETRTSSIELGSKILSRITLPPGHENAMPPPDSPEAALFAVEAVGMRRETLIRLLKKNLATKALPAP
jgi:hypothetical protein